MDIIYNKSNQDKAENILDLKVVILDFDDVCYWNTEDPYLAFKHAFANAASAALGMKPKHAFKLAIKGWLEKTDPTHWISVVHGQTEPEDFKKIKGDLDRLAHRILPTKSWRPFDNMAEAIISLRNQGLRVVVWTHGRREMVLYNMDRLIGAGAFKECDIFDKQSLAKIGHGDLRKDRCAEPYERLCTHLGVKPHECLLVDNEPTNLITSAQAGLQKGIHIIAPRVQPMTDWNYIRTSTNNTADALSGLSMEISSLKRTMPANVPSKPKIQEQHPIVTQFRLL